MARILREQETGLSSLWIGSYRPPGRFFGYLCTTVSHMRYEEAPYYPVGNNIGSASLSFPINAQ